jgi:hypothetical protein
MLKKRFFPLVLCITAIMISGVACSDGANQDVIEEAESPVMEVGEITLPAATKDAPLTTEEPTKSPTETSTPVPTETLVPVILYTDEFSDSNSGWEHYNEFDGVLDYEKDGYRMWVNVLSNFYWVAVDQTYSDVVIEVDAARMEGPINNQYGVFCRLAPGSNSFYFFLIGSDGKYGIGRYADFTQNMLSDGIAEPGLIRGENEWNQIRAACVGDNLSLTVNGEVLMELQDGVLESGVVGLAAGTFDEPGTDILFDNFQLVMP